MFLIACIFIYFYLYGYFVFQDSLLDLSSSSSSYSLQSFDISLNGSNNTNTLVKNSINNSTFNTSSDFYIIRITVDADNVDTDGKLNLIILLSIDNILFYQCIITKF